jgi:hypothetical protein
MGFHRRWPVGILGALLIVVSAAPAADAGGKLCAYGVYMKPQWSDAEDFSDPGWGGGMQAVAPLPQLHNLLAVVVGGEIVNLMTEERFFYDPYLQMDLQQSTSQNYYRVYLGPRIGPHGRGFFRPHAGTNLALVVYDISTDVVIPADYPEPEIRRTVRSRTEAALGWDITAGIDLNFDNKLAVDGGVRYLKSFNVPQQLGPEAVTVYPQYFQIYLSIGISGTFFPEN